MLVYCSPDSISLLHSLSNRAVAGMGLLVVIERIPIKRVILTLSQGALFSIKTVVPDKGLDALAFQISVVLLAAIARIGCSLIIRGLTLGFYVLVNVLDQHHAIPWSLFQGVIQNELFVGRGL